MGHVLHVGAQPAGHHGGVHEVGEPAQGVREAAALTCGRAEQARGHDPANRVGAELAGEHHVSDVQYGQFLSC